MDEEPTALALRIAAAFASDPDPCRKSPLRAATSTMAAREQRIFFIRYSFSACFSSAMTQSVREKNETCFSSGSIASKEGKRECKPL